MSSFTVIRTSELHVTSGSDIITYETEEFDINNDMDHESGVFTCTIAGYYYFSFSFWPSMGYPVKIYLYQNVTNVKARLICAADTDKSGGRYSTKTMGVTVHMQIGDAVHLRAHSETNIAGSSYPHNIFTGFLVHAT
ncbi:complement C1q tumor necrosis factor-related protein 4-like [Amphiura filiformis]|uniref:complement C1q tumor necrosis factor-related protein 4-like n=1 Tax=Amphiura filiformis TaxID=82378 RepID=UPI003B21D7F1